MKRALIEVGRHPRPHPLTTILDEPLRAWDAKGQRVRATYDSLRRPLGGYLQPAAGSETLLSRVIYSDALPDPALTNHRGRVYRTEGEPTPQRALTDSEPKKPKLP